MDRQVHLIIGGEIKKHFQEHAPIVFGFGHKITILCQFKRMGNEVLQLVKQLQANWGKIKKQYVENWNWFVVSGLGPYSEKL